MVGWMVQNGLLCAVLAAVAWALCRWGRLGPVARHAVWLLVLIKLLTPPVVAWPWAVRDPLVVAQRADGRPAGTMEMLQVLLQGEGEARRDNGAEAKRADAPLPAATSGPTATSGAPAAADGAAVAADTGSGPQARGETGAARWTGRRMLAAVFAAWLAGSMGFALLQAIRIGRMVRRVAGAKRVTALEEEVRPVARRMGMRGMKARVVTGLESPYVWSLVRPVLLWPAEMAWDTAAAQAMMVHELAHIKRRDHWVGWMMLLAGCVWWWNPVYWRVCRRLKEEAEFACDGWVVGTLPGARRMYAEALLRVCEGVRRPAPVLAAGIADGGKRILERRLRMIMRENVTLRLPRMGLAGLGVLALAALPGWSQTSSAPVQPTFTLSKETTVITSPLNADGTPDYVGAINAKQSQGVTPENNAFVAWIEIVGTRREDGNLAGNAIERVLAMSGAKATPDGAEVWGGYQAYQDFLVKEKMLDEAGAEAKQDEMLNARLEMWKPEQKPVLAEYLQRDDKWLGKIVEATGRTKWWSPAVDNGVAGSQIGVNVNRPMMIGVLLPSLGRLRDAANELAAQATLRAAAGDFDGFLTDVVAVKRLSRLLSKSPTTIEALVADSMNHVADDAIGTAVGSGNLSAAQCAALAKALEGLPAKGDLVDAAITGERWSMLDMVIWAMRGGDLDHLMAMISSATQARKEERFGTMMLGEIDLDVMLKFVNRSYDQLARSMRAPTLAEMRKIAADQEAEIQQWTQERNASTDLRKRPEETREAYSERMARMILSVMMPSLNRAVELDRAELARDDGLRVLLAAAGEKARTGKWPETLGGMVPGVIKEVPADYFSADGKAPLKYVVTANGARVYSVGRNQLDDGGKYDMSKKWDDIVVGP